MTNRHEQQLSTRPIVIAGPCAAETREQVMRSAENALKRDIPIMRASLTKPRTKHGWDGLGREGIPLLVDVAKQGIIPATEVMDAEDAEALMNAVFGETQSEVVLWLGSRNQNHKIQREIGELIANDNRVRLGIKNQPWPSEDHWKGIVSHLVDGGKADPSQLFLIHRGFAPEGEGLRNPPDFAMAGRVRHDTGLPMLLDPSHIGGTKEKVIEVTEGGMNTARHGVIFDGLMIEVHPNSQEAITDANQQLSWKEFDEHIQPLLPGQEIIPTAAD